MDKEEPKLNVEISLTDAVEKEFQKLHWILLPIMHKLD